MAAVAYRHWSFRRNVFRPDGMPAAVSDADQFYLNGQPIPNDIVHGVRTLFGLGYVEVYVRDARGQVQVNDRGDDVVSVKLWGHVALWPKAKPPEIWTHGIPAPRSDDPPARPPLTLERNGA
jgi:hypothetical protein